MTIVNYPNEALRQKCQPVKRIDSQVLEVVKKLKLDLKNSPNGVGLAAPQVGEALRILVIDHPEGEEIDVYINPEIIDTFGKDKIYPQVYNDEGGKEDFFEGCLSFPGVYGTVKRWLEIKVRYQTFVTSKVNSADTLEVKEETIDGLTAIVFQHELDHLDGVLFIDHIKKDNGQAFRDSGDGLEEIDIEKVISHRS
jgi:peptide deformylase